MIRILNVAYRNITLNALKTLLNIIQPLLAVRGHENFHPNSAENFHVCIVWAESKIYREGVGENGCLRREYLGGPGGMFLGNVFCSILRRKPKNFHYKT